MAFESLGAEMKSLLGNGPYCSRIHGQICHLVSPPCPNEANKPGYGQLYIFDCAKATTERLENQSNRGRMAEVMQRLDEKLRQVNPVAESYKRIQQMGRKKTSK
jgi:hypothetical protein